MGTPPSPAGRCSIRTERGRPSASSLGAAYEVGKTVERVASGERARMRRPWTADSYEVGMRPREEEERASGAGLLKRWAVSRGVCWKMGSSRGVAVAVATPARAVENFIFDLEVVVAKQVSFE